MKKRILSLILVLMLIPFASLFSACGKDKGYNLNNLVSDYNSIANENNNVKLDGGVLSFDYSSYGNVQEIIDNTNEYKILNDYNFVFENLMMFASNNVAKCSNNSATKNVAIKNQTQQDLIEFKKSVSDVNQCFNLFAEMILVSQSNPTSSNCVGRFNNLIKTYDAMFENGRKFNNTLANLYFNNILNDGNPNVYAVGRTNFNANMVISKIRSRIEWEISLLSSSFVEMTDDFNLSDNNYYTDNGNNNDSYMEKLLKVASLKEDKATERANHEDNKSSFFNLAVQAQNIQTVLNNENSKYVYACNEIDYIAVSAADSASAQQKLCASIIEENYNTISTYANVLSQMLVIMLG